MRGNLYWGNIMVYAIDAGRAPRGTVAEKPLLVSLLVTLSISAFFVGMAGAGAIDATDGSSGAVSAPGSASMLPSGIVAQPARRQATAGNAVYFAQIRISPFPSPKSPGLH